MLNEIEQLNGAPRSWKNVDLLVAANNLAFLEYERFKLYLKHADKEYILSVDVRQFRLSNIIHPMSQNCLYSSREDICDCTHCFTQAYQCVNEIKLCD